MFKSRELAPQKMKKLMAGCSRGLSIETFRGVHYMNGIELG